LESLGKLGEGVYTMGNKNFDSIPIIQIARRPLLFCKHSQIVRDHFIKKAA
jgi:hypothetical protein